MLCHNPECTVLMQILSLPHWTFSQLPIHKFQNLNCRRIADPKYYQFMHLFSVPTIVTRKDLTQF